MNEDFCIKRAFCRICLFGGIGETKQSMGILYVSAQNAVERKKKKEQQCKAAQLREYFFLKKKEKQKKKEKRLNSAAHNICSEI